jgi:hypothetical protein
MLQPPASVLFGGGGVEDEHLCGLDVGGGFFFTPTEGPQLKRLARIACFRVCDTGCGRHDTGHFPPLPSLQGICKI